MSAIASNPWLLLNLKGLLDGGCLTPDEFAAEKAKLFTCVQGAFIPETPTHIIESTGRDLLQSNNKLVENMGGIADGMSKQATVQATAPDSPPLTATSRKRSASSTGTTSHVWREPNQLSLFDLGVMVVIPEAASKRRRYLVTGAYKCSHCNFQCKTAGGMAMHTKHKHPTLS